MISIPSNFRPQAKLKAERMLAMAEKSGASEHRKKMIVQSISEEEWKQDRMEWSDWMSQMKAKSYQMFATPQERVNYEKLHHRR